MQFNTLRRLGSISGRTIAAIALSSATVLALAPSAKAQSTGSTGLSITVAPVNVVTVASVASPTSTDLEVGNFVPLTLAANNNTGTSWTIKAYSTNGSSLKGTGTSAMSLGYKVSTKAGNLPNVGTSPTGTLVNLATLGNSLSTATTVYTAPANSEFAPVVIDVKVKTDALFKTVKADTYTDTITYVIANGS